MAEPKTASAKKVDEPAIFVFANNRTNFESQIELDVTILNVNKIGKSEHLTSPQFFIQSLPFRVDIHHETKKPSGKKAIKIDNLNVQLVVGKSIQDQWSSQFSVDFLSTQVLQFQNFVQMELSDTNDTIAHTIEFDAVRKHRNFYFEMRISADQPNGGYEWPSYEATGYNGIVNEGATCYINCLLQSLYFTNAFRRLVYGTPIESEDINESFLFWLKYIFFTLQFNGLPKITTKKMIKCFNWNEMDETSQQDVQEFLRLLMDKIEQFVDGTEFKQRLTDLFVGTMETTIQCQNVEYRTSKREAFWDVQLSIDESPNIYGAFGVYLEAITINDFKYDEEGGAKDEAMQEFQIIKWPPVLHVHLKRFSYDVKANSLTKNNKRFKFFSQLDLSHFSDDAIYTLHSVLVHSGSLGSGHYVSYICPKADNHWFKFNDEIVTECSASNAIQDNYGDGSSSTSAYMLVYVKTSCIQEILQDVSEADVSDKALIERELTKEIEELENQHKFFEVIVFTSSLFQNDTKLKKGKSLFDSSHGRSFFIEKEKNLEDLYEVLLQAFGAESVTLWLLNIKKQSIRFCDVQSFFDKPLNTLCNKDQAHFFVEHSSPMGTDQSMDTDSSIDTDPFQKNKQSLILIKEYDSVSKRLIFHTHHYFQLNETVAELQAFIKDDIQYDGSAENIAILVEKGSGEQYSCREWEPHQSISKIVTKFSDTSSAIVVFEIVAEGRRPKYIQSTFTGANNSSKNGQQSAVEEIENGIDVSVKSDDTGDEFVGKKFSPFDQLLNIVECLSSIQGCSTADIQLLDTERNIIDTQYLHTTLEAYLNERNKDCRTRRQKQKIILFTFKMVHSDFSQPMEFPDDFNESTSECGVPVKNPSPDYASNSMDLDANDIMPVHMAKEALESPPKVQEPEMADEVEMVNAVEPAAKVHMALVRFLEADSKFEVMAKEYARREMMDRILAEFISHNKMDFNGVIFSDQKDQLVEAEARPLELYLDCDQIELQIYFKAEETMKKRKIMKRTKSTDQSTTVNSQRQKRQVYLSFKDQTAKRDPMDMDFDDTEMFSVALERIADVMDMDRSKSHFFDSNGAEITRFKGTVSQYLKSHSTTIDYKVIDRSVLDVLVVNSNGYSGGVQSIPINRSTTVGDICDSFESKHAQLVKMKEDVIDEILARNTKANKLIDDGHAYRIDLYSTSFGCTDEIDMFHVCVKFIGDSPPERQNTPLLVKMKNGQTLKVIGLQLINLLRMTNVKAYTDFQYSIDGKFEKQDHVLMKPNDPKTIPVVLLNLNQSKTRKPNFSYKKFFNN